MKSSRTNNAKNEMVELYESARRHVKSRGYCQEIVEDFPAWVIEHRLRGNSSAVHILLVNFLRHTLGVKGTTTNAMKKAMVSSADSTAAAELLECSNGGAEDALIVAELLRGLPDRESLVVRMNVLEGRTNKEIGLHLDLTEARVCQILKAALSSLKELATG